MKHFWLLIGVAVTMVLTGCAKVPDCGDEKTIKLTKELIFESLLGAEAKNLSDMFKVEISAVQTLSHTKDPEKYSCKANIKISADGKMNELFGNSSDELTRMYNHKLTEAEVEKLKKYVAFADDIDRKQTKINLNDVEVTLEKVLLIQYFKRDINLYANDRDTLIAKAATFLMLKIASTTTELYEPKILEFVSTTAQQDGKAEHLVEIRKLWSKPNLLLIELAKFAKTYMPPVATAKPVQPALAAEPTPVVIPNEPRQEAAQNTTLPISPSFDCAKATSNAEKLICSNAELATSDAELSRAYKSALSNHPDQADAIRTEQINWRKNIRDQCADVSCMLDAYRNRNTYLNQ